MSKTNYTYITTRVGHYRVAWESLTQDPTDPQWVLRVEKLRWLLYFKVVDRRVYLCKPYNWDLTVNYLDALKAVRDYEMTVRR